MGITTILFVVQIILAVMITIVVLLQKSSSIGLGAYSGSNESVFGAKGPAGFMAKFTMALGLIVVCNTIALGYFYNQASSKSVIDSVQLPQSDIPNAPDSPLSAGNTESDASAFIVDENAAPSAPIFDAEGK